MSDEPPEQPHAVFAQPELPLDDIEPLGAVARVEQWIASQPEQSLDPSVVQAHLYLHDRETREQRAARWIRVRQIDARCMNEWGVLVHGGHETLWLLGESARGLMHRLWLASLLASHAACERHIAGVLSFYDDALPKGWDRWGLGPLVDEAEARSLVPEDLLKPLRTVNEVRKVSAHFKPPTHAGTLFDRARQESDWLASAEDLAEGDAFLAYETARGVVHRMGLGS